MNLIKKNTQRQVSVIIKENKVILLCAIMDLRQLLSALMFVVILKLVTSETVKSPDEWLSNAVENTRREARSNNKDSGNSLLSVQGLGNSVENNCCLNGGTCVMNSFCHCPKKYYGRYCEHRVRHRSCGTIRHGTWMASGCHLCHCFDGQMRCKVTKIKGCNNLSYIEGIEKDPDYLVGMDTKYDDYERFYDVYDNPGDKAVSGSSGLTASVLFAVFAVSLTGWIS